MKVDVESVESRPVVRVTGEVDASNSSILQETLDQLITDGCRRIILVFNEVSYISSGGLRVLLHVVRELLDSGKLILVGVRSSVMDVLSMTGFSNLLEIHDELGDALKMSGEDTSDGGGEA